MGRERQGRPGRGRREREKIEMGYKRGSDVQEGEEGRGKRCRWGTVEGRKGRKGKTEKTNFGV